MMKRTRFATLLCLLMSACYSPRTPSPEEEPQTHESGPARANLGAEPSTLDPRRARDLASVNMVRLLFEGLARINPLEKPELALAESVMISSDLKTYTFRLRESFWSNGDPLTAEDFVYAWKAQLSPDFPSDYAFQLYVLRGAKEAKLGEAPLDHVGVRAIDTHILEVELEEACPYFLEFVAMPVFFPINHRVDRENPDWMMDAEGFVCNGPFKLESWQHQYMISLKKSPRYWDAETVELAGLHFAIVNEETEMRMFEKGELDWAGSPLSRLPIEALPHLKERGELSSKAACNSCFLRCNTRHPLLCSRELRKALAVAINRSDLVTHVLQGGQIPSTGLVPPTLGLKQEPYFNDGDVKAAAEYFAVAREELSLEINDSRTITLLYSESNRNRSIAQAIQQQWREALGVEIRLASVEKKVFFDRVSKRDFDLALSDWIADFNDPINFLNVFKYRTASTNNTAWEDPEYVCLLEASGREIDPAVRRELLARCEEILIDSMPIIPLYQNQMLYLVSDRLKDVAVSSMGMVDFRWARMEPAEKR